MKNKTDKLSWKQLKETLCENGINTFILCIAILIMMVGMTCNFIVMMENNGKMPVISEYEYNDKYHFTYQNFSGIRYPYLSDYIRIQYSLFSIGDLIMLFAFILALLAVIKTSILFMEKEK